MKLCVRRARPHQSTHGGGMYRLPRQVLHRSRCGELQSPQHRRRVGQRIVAASGNWKNMLLESEQSGFPLPDGDLEHSHVPLEVGPVASVSVTALEPCAEKPMAELMPPLVEHAMRHDVRLARVALREHAKAAHITASRTRHELEVHDALLLSLTRVAFVIT